MNLSIRPKDIFYIQMFPDTHRNIYLILIIDNIQTQTPIYTTIFIQYVLYVLYCILFYQL